MGMYTGIRFKGIVKKEFRNGFDSIALGGEWSESKWDIFKKFGELGRSSFIPCGALAYMPDEWETDYIDGNGNKVIEFSDYYVQEATDGFIRTWDEDTGLWTFQCSLKNYQNEIEIFFALIPFFIESIEHLEYFYEEDVYSQKYDLVNNEVIEVDSNFIKYGFDYFDTYQ